MSRIFGPLHEKKLEFMRKEMGEFDITAVEEKYLQIEDALSECKLPIYTKEVQAMLRNRRVWLEYAWLLSGESDRISGGATHVEDMVFIISYPRQQKDVPTDSDFGVWLGGQAQHEVVAELVCYIPRYAEAAEAKDLAIAIYHEQQGIEGNLRHVTIERLDHISDA